MVNAQGSNQDFLGEEEMELDEDLNQSFQTVLAGDDIIDGRFLN